MRPWLTLLLGLALPPLAAVEAAGQQLPALSSPSREPLSPRSRHSGMRFAAPWRITISARSALPSSPPGR